MFFSTWLVCLRLTLSQGIRWINIFSDRLSESFRWFWGSCSLLIFLLKISPDGLQPPVLSVFLWMCLLMYCSSWFLKWALSDSRWHLLLVCGRCYAFRLPIFSPENPFSKSNIKSPIGVILWTSSKSVIQGLFPTYIRRSVQSYWIHSFCSMSGRLVYHRLLRLNQYFACSGQFRTVWSWFHVCWWAFRSEKKTENRWQMLCVWQCINVFLLCAAFPCLLFYAQFLLPVCSTVIHQIMFTGWP